MQMTVPNNPAVIRGKSENCLHPASQCFHIIKLCTFLRGQKTEISAKYGFLKNFIKGTVNINSYFQLKLEWKTCEQFLFCYFFV